MGAKMKWDDPEVRALALERTTLELARLRYQRDHQAGSSALADKITLLVERRSYLRAWDANRAKFAQQRGNQGYYRKRLERLEVARQAEEARGYLPPLPTECGHCGNPKLFWGIDGPECWICGWQSYARVSHLMLSDPEESRYA